jgi:hypothetical protein
VGLVLAVVTVQAQVGGATKALNEIERLRRENAQLHALIIGRDREIANCHYEMQKRTMELKADLDESRLTARAAALLPTLRAVYNVTDEAVQFDWLRGVFVEPKKTEEKKENQQ